MSTDIIDSCAYGIVATASQLGYASIDNFFISLTA